mgnify:CR=1 FL=1
MKFLRSFKGFNIINISGDLATLMFSFLCGLVIMYVLTEFKERKSGELKTFVSYVFGNLSLILFLITFLGVFFSDQI